MLISCKFFSFQGDKIISLVPAQCYGVYFVSLKLTSTCQHTLTHTAQSITVLPSSSVLSIETDTTAKHIKQGSRFQSCIAYRSQPLAVQADSLSLGCQTKKIETTCFIETSVTICQPIRHNVPEDLNLDQQGARILNREDSGFQERDDAMSLGEWFPSFRGQQVTSKRRHRVTPQKT